MYSLNYCRAGRKGDRQSFVMNSRRAQEIIQQFANQRLIVLGDLMLDEFIWGEVRRISPEGPVPVVEV